MNLGRFQGTLSTVWLDDGRGMAVVDPFRYVDAMGTEWNVPAGFVTDGMSIPQWLWSFTGGPYSGKYRKAAVVHDVYCHNRARSWEETHKMLWQAMLCAGVNARRAELIYAAVYEFGPRWDAEGGVQPCKQDPEW